MITIVAIIAITWVALLALMAGMFRIATGTPTPLTSASDDVLGMADAVAPDRRLRPPSPMPAEAA